MGDWVDFNAVKLPWFTNESASETDSHDEDDFDEDEKGHQNPFSKVSEPKTKEELEKLKKEELNAVIGTVFKQRANSNVVKSYAADKALEEEKLAEAADSGPQANAEQVKRAETALREAQKALDAARESLAKAEAAELALKDKKAEFLKRKNDRERHLAKTAAKQKKEAQKHGPKQDDNPFGGFVMGIYASSTAKFTVLVVGRGPNPFPASGARAGAVSSRRARAGRTRSCRPG